MIRDRMALTLAALSAGALFALAAVAGAAGPSRPFDTAVLLLFGVLHLGFVITWVFLPRLPRWLAGGWGLILIAAGLGVVITAPRSDVPTLAWGFVGLVVVGLVTIVAAIVHRSGEATL